MAEETWEGKFGYRQAGRETELRRKLGPKVRVWRVQGFRPQHCSQAPVKPPPSPGTASHELQTMSQCLILICETKQFKNITIITIHISCG